MVNLAKKSESFIDWCYRRNENKMMKAAEKEVKKEAKSKRRQEVKDNLVEWYYTRKAEKQLKKTERELNKEAGIYNKKDLVKSFCKCALKGTLTCVVGACALISAASVFTIGFIPAVVSTSILFASYKLFNSSYKEETSEYKQIKECYSKNNNEIENDEEIKNEGFFTSLKKCFKKSDTPEITDEVSIGDQQFVALTPEELEEQAINVKDLVVTGDVSNVKLTREQKIAKVKAETKLARVKFNGVTSYCVFVAKDDIKLQRFIRAEYKKENPEEKVQSFEMGDNKVLVLNNRPNFK